MSPPSLRPGAVGRRARGGARRRPLAAIRRSVRAASRAFSGGLHYTLDDGKRETAEALTLMCPLISKAMDEETALEAAALDVSGARDAFRLAFNAVFGDWRRDPSVHVRPCRRGRAATGVMRRSSTANDRCASPVTSAHPPPSVRWSYEGRCEPRYTPV